MTPLRWAGGRSPQAGGSGTRAGKRGRQCRSRLNHHMKKPRPGATDRGREELLHEGYDMKLAPGVTVVTSDDVAKATSPSTKMALALAATGKKVYEGTVPGAVKAKRRAKNKAARAARKAARR